MQKNKEIQIDVHGLTGVGKSHVMATIKKALEAEYPCSQVSSYDLTVELNGSNLEDIQRPNPRDTIFWISEGKVSDFRKMIGKGR